jgi:Rrf2 family protein
MKFSSKAEYGLMAMTNLAKAYPEQKNLAMISREEGISLKYLEQLATILRKKNLITSTKGKQGGYVLAKKPNQLTVGEIVEALDGPIAPMKCIGKFCAKATTCSSNVVWEKVSSQIKKTLYSMKLNQIIR